MPFITSYRLAMNLNLQYFLNWDDECRDTDYSYEGEKTKYNHMFYNIDNVNYIDDYQLNQLQSFMANKKTLVVKYLETNLHNVSIEDLLKYDVVFFYNYVHPIFTKEDNVIINSYSDCNLSWILDKTNYYKDLQKYFKLLKPVITIQEKINEVLIQFPENKNNIIGFHIRHWPNSWVSTNNKYIQGNDDKRIIIMNNAIKNNPDIKFFISTTDINIIKQLKNLYNEKIIYFENRFGLTNNDKYYTSNQQNSKGNIYKNLNGLVDLYLLSSCNLIIGDVCSSYSHVAPLLNTNSTYQQIK
tara:strand:+ start:1838 stop:2734 length:897 start_codon:yes stop_codon:yes gene_type:complete